MVNSQRLFCSQKLVLNFGIKSLQIQIVIKLLNYLLFISLYFYLSLMVVRLLQKIGNELMKKCEAYIDVERVFSGYIISTKANIHQSIE